MDIYSLSGITGANWVYCEQGYIVIGGEKLWIYEEDGTFVACRADIKYANKIAFLPDKRILVSGGGNAAYRLISAVNGTDIWSVPRIKKMDFSFQRFAVTPDYKRAFDYYTWRDHYYIVEIDIEKGKINSQRLQNGFRATTDIVCNNAGVPLFLQTQYEELIEGRISRNGIVYQIQSTNSTGGMFFWYYEWKHEAKAIAKFFLDNPEQILTEDLHVYEPKTGNMYHLLENDPDWQSPGLRPSGCWLDSSKQYIFLMYDRVHIVVDWSARKMIARYGGYMARGCLVGNEYWISSDVGIRRVPFPLIEDIPGDKLTFLMPMQ